MMEAPKSIELSSTGGGGMGVLVGGRGWEGEWKAGRREESVGKSCRGRGGVRREIMRRWKEKATHVAA